MSTERMTWTVRLRTGPSVPLIAQGDPGGTPLVLLHAWAESSGLFDRLLCRLPDDQWVVSFDQRGHGAAERPDAGYTLEDFASDVVAVLDEVGAASAVLLGSSSGGYVAQQVAAQAPDRVAGLVLVGSPRTLKGLSEIPDEVAKMRDPVDEQWVRSSLVWFPMYSAVPEWYLEDRIADGTAVPARVWRDTLEGLITATPPTETGLVTAPALVIHGARDDLLSLADQEELVASIPGSRLLVYEDTGHLVLWEHPRRVARDTVGFLEQIGLR